MTDDEKAALADVYEKAAEYLERYGWLHTGGGGKHGGARCFIGATLSALNNHYVPLWHESSRFAEDILELPYGGIMGWNDDPSRTADEVINTLHALANKLR